MTTETFTSDATWTAPAGVTSVTVECWGGGGGGGGGYSSYYGYAMGGGGGGGAYAKSVIGVTPGNAYAIVVGAGGPDATSDAGDGSGGGSTTFDSTSVVAAGGAGGKGISGAGGAGGLASASTGTTKYDGGTGGAGQTTGAGLPGGGGSSAGTASAGTTGGTGASGGAGGVAPTGGGDGGAYDVSGSTPGGGGGGKKLSFNVSDGASGKVVLTYTAATPTNTALIGIRFRAGVRSKHAPRSRKLDGALGHTGFAPPPPTPNAALHGIRFRAGVRSKHAPRSRKLDGALFNSGGFVVPFSPDHLRTRFRKGLRTPHVPHTVRLDRAARLGEPNVAGFHLATRFRQGLRSRHQALVKPIRPHMIDWGRRYATARGLYRVFNTAGYRFYRSNTSTPPAEGDAPFATNATLPHTPADLYADGTWLVSVSYFNGVVDSGFLPIGPNGETYLRLDVSGASATSGPPQGPGDWRLEQRPGGVVRVLGFYFEAGTLRATEWAIAYTTDGTTPAVDAPSVTATMTANGLVVLSYDLPAQAHGTTVNVRLQTRRGTSYSEGSTVQTATADGLGPTAPHVAQGWRGRLPEDV